MYSGNKIALVLSGGSAHGLAHIGVIKALEEEGIFPEVIAGTSAGSLVGGLYASGMKIKEIENIFTSFSKKDIRKLIKPSFMFGGLFTPKKIKELYKGYVKGKKIEDLEKKFVAASVDIVSGELHYFSKGDLSTAVRCSISIPGLFQPYRTKENIFIDGGLMDNLPLRAVKKWNPSVVIASVAKKTKEFETVIDSNSSLVDDRSLVRRIRDFFFSEYNTAVKILKRSLELSLTETSMKEIRAEKPAVTILIDPVIGASDFHRAKEAIQKGYETTKELLGENRRESNG